MNRLAVLIHIVFLLISCSSPDHKDSKKVFKYNASNGITSLDPAFARNQDNIWACNLLFNGLVQTDTLLNVVPCISNYWKISPDGLTYTFNLRDSVYFHSNKVFKNGQRRKVVAQDFVYSFNRIIDPETASPGAWIFNDRIAPNGFQAPDDRTFSITLLKPFPPLLGMLSMPYCFVVPKEAVEFYGKDFGLHPVGTGPFVFKEWYDGIRLNLLKNEDYFESTPEFPIPALDAVSISFIQSKHSEFMELIQGRLDMLNGIESSFKDEILTPDGKLNPAYEKDFYLVKSSFLNTEYLAFQVEPKKEKSLAADPHFRKALHAVIDKDQMVKFMRNNVGKAAHGGFIPIGLPGFLEQGQNQLPSLEQAKSELALSTYQKGDLITLYTTKDYLDLCLLVQKQAKLIGVELKVEVLPSSLLKTEKSEGRLSLFRASWIADYPDAENYLSCFISSNKAPAGPNYTRFSNDTYDSLYRESLRAVDLSERLSLYQQMDRILAESSVIIPLFYDQSVRIYRKQISGMRHDALNSLQLKYTSKN